jgi:hypothetical protein
MRVGLEDWVCLCWQVSGTVGVWNVEGVCSGG